MQTSSLKGKVQKCKSVDAERQRQIDIRRAVSGAIHLEPTPP